MGGTFTITELLAEGATVVGGPARFEWTAEQRSIPKDGFTLGTAVRNKRADYAGGDEPSHQILGPNCKDMDFTGEWDDRWNGDGYARATMRAFDDMVRRANLVRVEFSGLSWTGLITDVDYPYRHDARIGYRFKLSPQAQEDAAPLRPVANANRPLSASSLTDNLAAVTDQLDQLQDQAPASVLAGTFLDDLNGALDDVAAAFAEADAAVQQRIVAPGEEARISVLRASQLFTQVATASARALDQLIEWRSDLQLQYATAKNVLDFDAWSREMSARLRLLGVYAADSSAEVERRADADAKALYRPREGEHLMGISTQFYGTPHQWRAIAERNQLTYPVMTGDEILVIPGAAPATEAA